jgi:hypothetical protein
MSDKYNNMKIDETTMSTMYSLAFYSPIIITIGIFMLSIFLGTIGKGLFYIFWLFIITAVRIFVIYIFKDKNGIVTEIPQICNTGSFLPNTNLTYSTYIMSFTLFYLLTPMMLISSKNKIDAVNYFVLIFFIFYIVFDIFVKKSLNCISSIFSLKLFSDLLGGIILGIVVSYGLMQSSLRNNLFINELMSNKEVCAMPSNQKFKCSVYKNGELVSSTIN